MQPVSTQPTTAAEMHLDARHSISGIRRRHRAVQSCYSCRLRKVKCDKQRPCRTCQTAGRDCDLEAQNRDHIHHGRRNPEKVLIRSAAHQPGMPLPSLGSLAPFSSTEPASHGSHDSLAEALHGHSSLEIDKVSFADAFYEDTTGECFENLDLGVQLGRMRIMERYGGYHQPRLIQQIGNVLDVVQRRSNVQLPPATTPITGMPLDSTAPSYLQPGSDFIAPSEGFFFCSGPLEIERGFLNLEMCQSILKHYWGTAHVLCKCLHRSSFEKQWDTFWTCIATGMEPPITAEAVVMAVLLSGTIATPELSLTAGFSTPKSTIVNSFKAATESALARAKFVRTTKLDILQALVIYLISICRGQLSREHIALLGVTIGIAESMGLHRDPELYDFNVLETHVRRLIWHQLCFLDLRACEAHRPRPQIREDDFDTIIPPSVNDQALDCPLNAGIWTDTSFSIINFECSVMNRVIWFARPRLERKETDISTVLGLVMDFRTRMLSKYMFLKNDVPIQRYGRLVLEVCIAKLFSMVLHRYHRAIQSKLPDKIYQMLFDQVILQLSHVLTLETSPELQPWSWYVGAWNHYRTAIILLEEISVHPSMPKAEEIWRILDYVFLQPPGLTRDEKSIAILSQAKERLSIYSRLKKMKYPANFGPRYDQLTESSNTFSTQSNHTTTGGAVANAERIHENHSPMPTTIARGTSDIDLYDELQYSPSVDMEIFDNIDWTRWDYSLTDDLD